MKSYRKPAGHYIEVSDTTPVSETLVEVCKRPSDNHVFSDNWQSDPLNLLVCWREKTAQELAAETETTHRRDFSGREDTLLNLLFTAANDIRVLKGQQPITKAQFWNFVKNLHANDKFFDGTF